MYLPQLFSVPCIQDRHPLSLCTSYKLLGFCVTSDQSIKQFMETSCYTTCGFCPGIIQKIIIKIIMMMINAEKILATYAFTEKKACKIQACPRFVLWPLRYRCRAITNWASEPNESWSFLYPAVLIYEILIFIDFMFIILEYKYIRSNLMTSS